MERNSKSVEKIVEGLITLLIANDESAWADYLNKLLVEYRQPATRSEAIKRFLEMYKGGMGSFTDLVLQRDYKMLVEENNQLAELKHQLYKSCMECLQD